MTDRSLTTSADLDALSFDDGGLLPVVAQDSDDGRLLMVAWANREALKRSLESGDLHFWSRSRDELWRKGETSGNVLRVRSLHADCDGDTVLALVRPDGPACHTGESTCFGELPADTVRGIDSTGVLDALWKVIVTRDEERPEGSYTTRLLTDENLRLKKLGEETAELVTALARGEPGAVRQEAADLVYHLLVALRGAGVGLEEMLRVLDGRRR